MCKLLQAFFYIISIFCLLSCKKDFLEKKPDTKMITPQSLDDLRKLLDNTDVINESPGLSQLSCDDYYFYDFQSWQNTFYARERNAYIWAQDIYQGEVAIRDWNIPYQQIFYANTVLEALKTILYSNSTFATWKNLKADALFVRANALYNLASLFCAAYDSASAATQLGLPIRLSPNIDEIKQRSSLKDTYAQIITDLREAAALSNIVLQPKLRNRPCKSACYGLLARVYLSMGNYTMAGSFADSSLNLYNKLIDYNTISTTSTAPFTPDNDEVLYSSTLGILYNSLVLLSSNYYMVIDSTLYNLYSSNDLRKQIYFRASTTGTTIIKRGYQGSILYGFSGLATDELYLIRAECFARAGNLNAAMKDLNDLLRLRWKKNSGISTYVDQVAASVQDALNKILSERRKELVYRGIRWTDLKRLNKEGANITLTRKLNGQTYLLPPNDVRYVFPIPSDELALSNIQQNPR